MLDLRAYGAMIDGLYVCPHHPDDGCDCRKPATSLYLRAAGEHHIDLTRSYMIGDKVADLLAARNLSMASILVQTGYGASSLAEIAQWREYRPVFVAGNLKDAADWILARQTKTQAS